MAVDLWSEVTVERSDKFEIVAEGDGAEQMPTDESNYMVVGCKAAFDTANKPMPTLKYSVKNRIPFARGLGSSSAGIVAGIVAGLVLAGHRLPCWGSEALLQIAAGIEVSVCVVLDRWMSNVCERETPSHARGQSHSQLDVYLSSCCSS
jgi:homoserine kinase